MSKSLELLDKIVEKYDWLGKEYCQLIGKGDELHKFNQTAFVECLVTPIEKDLERLEQLEKENEDLKVFVDAYANARDELLIRNQKLEKAIEKQINQFENLIYRAKKLKTNDIIVCLEEMQDRLKEVLKDE